MKTNLPALGILIGLCLLPAAGRAQSYWLLKYEGTSVRTNKAGQIASRPMTDKTLARLCANNAGVSNATQLSLVLHLNATSLGDTLEVVNTGDPNLFRCEVLKLAFAESFTNSSGTFIKTFAYIYNDESDIFGDPSAHSRGSAVITRKTTRDSHGATHTTITGKLQFWLGVWLENAPANDVVVCAGTFAAQRPLNLP
jgi:hypothetical protein